MSQLSHFHSPEAYRPCPLIYNWNLTWHSDLPWIIHPHICDVVSYQFRPNYHEIQKWRPMNHIHYQVYLPRGKRDYSEARCMSRNHIMKKVSFFFLIFIVNPRKIATMGFFFDINPYLRIRFDIPPLAFKNWMFFFVVKNIFFSLLRFRFQNFQKSLFSSDNAVW